MNHTIGNRYRIDHMGHALDGRIVVLERVEDQTGWIEREGKFHPVPLSCLRDKGVMQNLPERIVAHSHFVRLFEVLEPAQV